MKFIILLFALVFSLSMIAFPQAGTEFFLPGYGQNSNTNRNQYVTDSTWYSLGNAFGQYWFKNRIYRVNQRNSAGDVRLAYDHEYDTLGLYWFKQRQYEAQFLNDTIRKLWLSSVFDQSSGSWLLSDSIHFNISGAPTRSWYKVWDPLEHKFTGGRLTDFIYDDQGFPYLSYNKFYDTTAGNWQKDFYEVIQQNQYHLDSLRQISVWDKSSGDWQDSLRIIYTYDQKLNPQDEIHQKWLGNNWENFKKWEFKFVDNLPDETYEYTWDTFSESWEYKNFSDYDYYPDQSLEKITVSLWDGYEWLNKTRKSYIYNTLQQPIEILNEYWSFGFNQWSKSSLNNYDYDKNGNRNYFAFFIWDDYNLRWRNFYKEENFWALFEAQTVEELGIIDFEIYPNPTAQKVQIFLSETDGFSKNKQLMLYSVDGRLVYFKLFSGSSESMDMSGFPSGNFHLIIKTEKGIGSRVVVKK